MQRSVMQRTIWSSAVGSLITAILAVGCSKESAPPAEEPAAAPPAAAEPVAAPPAEPAEAESLPDPGPEEAKLVEDHVRQWVAERAGEDGAYDIPQRAEHNVSGTIGDFHTVHQKDADTYSVCIDFNHEADTYDVDFFVARTEDGLSVSDHYLHKINGEAVE